MGYTEPSVGQWTCDRHKNESQCEGIAEPHIIAIIPHTWEVSAKVLDEGELGVESCFRVTRAFCPKGYGEFIAELEALVKKSVGKPRTRKAKSE